MRISISMVSTRMTLWAQHMYVCAYAKKHVYGYEKKFHAHNRNGSTNVRTSVNMEHFEYPQAYTHDKIQGQRHTSVRTKSVPC
jgi:hypothetical protein